MDSDLKAAPKAVFGTTQLATHMPFSDGTTLLFCQAGAPIEMIFVNRGSIWKTIRQNPSLTERFKNLPKSQQIPYRPWKLAYCNWQDKVIRRIDTGLLENGIECSPAFYRNGNEVNLSFVGGTPSEQGMVYRLYTSSGPDLEHLEPAKALPERPVFFGFVSPHHICWGSGNLLKLTEKASGKTLKYTSEFKRMLRATFTADDPAKLLVTGIDAKQQHRTVLFDLANGKTSEISAGGPVYKSSLHGKQVVFAKRTGKAFEDRELHHSDYSLLPCEIKITPF